MIQGSSQTRTARNATGQQHGGRPDAGVPPISSPPRLAAGGRVRGGCECCGRGAQLPIGGHDVHREQIIAGKAALAHQIAETTAKGDPGDPGGGDEAAGRGQAECLGFVIELSPIVTSAVTPLARQAM